MGVLLLLLAVGAGVVLLVAAVIAYRTRRRPLAMGCLAGFAGVVGLYLVALVGVSLASPRRVLEQHEVKRFCGFYLDCHLGVSVDEVQTAKTIIHGPFSAQPKGTFYIVTLRVSSNAVRATLEPWNLVARVVDEKGRRYGRNRDAERALFGREADRPLEERVAAGGAYTRRLVFDVPDDARTPALAVTEEGFPDALIEGFLIGDEDSFLHRPTLLALSSSASLGARH